MAAVKVVYQDRVVTLVFQEFRDIVVIQEFLVFQDIVDILV